MCGDLILRPRWPQVLVLDPEGCGGSGSGGLYWEGWLPHSHIGAIAKGLNCIFCSKTGGNPISKSSSKCNGQDTHSQRGLLEILIIALDFSEQSPSIHPTYSCWELVFWIRCSKINSVIKHWTGHLAILQVQEILIVFLFVCQVLAEQDLCLEMLIAQTSWNPTSDFLLSS
jgi:hypothetical protein